MTAPAKVYIVVELAVHDPADFEQYRTEVAPIIANFGGRYLVRGGATESLEGEPPYDRLVLIEFPDMRSARGFIDSEEYKPVAKIRHRSAKSRIFLAEGMAG